MPKQPSLIYQLKVTLDHTQPPIWRRIQVPGSTSLGKLHDILQIVMGWQDYHLHMFTIDGEIYGDPEQDEYGDIGSANEAKFPLSKVIHSEGQRFRYEYDFGDSWNHTLLVEKILPPEEGVRYPLCLKGKRACPPEDVGGVWGYQNFLEAMADPENEEHESFREWIGDDFDPEEFNLDGINSSLNRMGRGSENEADNAWSAAESVPGDGAIKLDSPWPQSLAEDQRVTAENLPLRRDMLTLLTYLRDNKVNGTQSTGNLPLKAVNDICAQFVKPPIWDDALTGKKFHVRSESEVWPIFFLHVLAVVGGLAAGSPGKRWTLTPVGQKFLSAPAALQVWLLYATWWTQVNWAIAADYYVEDEDEIFLLQRTALKSLFAIPADKKESYEGFAAHIIEETGMTWPIVNQDSARFILHRIIEDMVVDPQVDFGVLQTEYQPHPEYGPEIPVLSTIQVTPFGRGLLEAFRDALKANHP